jgi:hypothetical protein
MGKSQGPLLLRLSIILALGLAVSFVDVLGAALFHGAMPEGSHTVAHARGRRGGGGGFGGRDRFDPTPQRQSFRSKDDDRQPDRTPERQNRESDEDRKRDDQQDDERNNSDGNRGRSRVQDEGKPSTQMPRTVSEMINRMLKPPLGSVPPDLFDVKIGGLTTNEILAVNTGPGLLERARQLGFEVRHTTTLGLLNLSIVRLVAPPGIGAAEARALLERGTHSGHFAFNHVYRPYRPATGDQAETLPPEHSEAEAASTCSGRCYAQRIIKWQPKLQSCALKTRIGFIDASVDLDHPSLVGRNIRVGDFRRDARPAKSSQHGTSTLAVLAGGPGGTVAGLLPNSEYFAADIFFPDEHGEPVADTMALLQAFDWMSAWDVRLVNLSLAGPHDLLMQRAIERMTRNGVVFVAAAGNDGPDGPPLYPAAYKDVIAVSAIAKDLRSYHRANRGNYIDVSAPGVAIWTAVPGGEGYQSGTSFAVPFVTAIIATVSKQVAGGDKNALLSALDYKDLGPAGRDPIFGRGLILAPRRCAPGGGPPLVAIKPRPPAHAGWTLETAVADRTSSGIGPTGALDHKSQR